MLHVGQGSSASGVTLFPIWQDRATDGLRGYDTAVDTLEISEADGGPAVPQLVAHNTGERPVLVLDGQLFEGGWQHRMATRSLLVAAGERTTIDVACVEQSRWGGERRQTTYGRRATAYVRHGYDEPGGQGEVWERVRSYGVASPTASLAARLSTPDEVAQRLLRKVRPLPGQTGVLVGIAGQPFALEAFDHPQTLREQFEVIARAACLDAEGRAPLPTPGRRARRMVERLERTRVVVEPPVGRSPRLGRARTTDLDVMSLQQRQARLHLRVTYRRHPILMGA